MGQLTNQYFRQYSTNTKIFIETGSYKGDTIQTAWDFGFKEIHSIEINETLLVECQTRFCNHPNVNLYLGDSPDVLPHILDKIDEPATFWLDAHRAFTLNVEGSPKYGPVPLLQELAAIGKSKIKNHVIFIDDCRLLGGKTWNYLSKDQLLDAVFDINPAYKIDYLDGGVSFGVTNPKDDIMVAYTNEFSREQQDHELLETILTTVGKTL